MAVPCWSSWKTGISSFCRRFSMSKHCGALMSSRLMPPNVGAMSSTARTISSTSCVSRQMGTESTPAKPLKRMDLPSMTGRRQRRCCRGRVQRCRSSRRRPCCPCWCSHRSCCSPSESPSTAQRRPASRPASGPSPSGGGPCCASRSCRGVLYAGPMPGRSICSWGRLPFSLLVFSPLSGSGGNQGRMAP